MLHSRPQIQAMPRSSGPGLPGTLTSHMRSLLYTSDFFELEVGEKLSAISHQRDEIKIGQVWKPDLRIRRKQDS